MSYRCQNLFSTRVSQHFPCNNVIAEDISSDLVLLVISLDGLKKIERENSHYSITPLRTINYVDYVDGMDGEDGREKRGVNFMFILIMLIKFNDININIT